MMKIFSILVLSVFFFQINLRSQILLNRHLSDKIDLKAVKEHKIKSIDYGDFYEEFDQYGNHLFLRGLEWPHGRRFENKFDENNLLIARYSFDDEGKDTVRTDLYTYDETGKLIEINSSDTLGEYVTKYRYNKNGNIIAIESPLSYEKYKYTESGDIKFFRNTLKGEYLARRSQLIWIATYNLEGRLIQETQTHDKKYKVTWLYKYDEKGRIIECINSKREARKAIFNIIMTYNDIGLLETRTYYDINDFVVYKQNIKYEFY